MKMLDNTDFGIYNGTLDISRIPKKQLQARFKSIIGQLMILSNTNTKMCWWLQQNHPEIWDALINHDFRNEGDFPSEIPDETTSGEEE